MPQKSHSFSDTHSDPCDCQQAPEDSFHFLLRCKLFANCRQKLLDDVQIILRKYNLTNILDNLNMYLYGHHTITVNMYLYGHHTITVNDNKNILRPSITNESVRFL